MDIKENISEIRSNIEPVKLVVVTKKQPLKKIRQVIDAGVKIIAENRVGEAERKYVVIKGLLEKNDVQYHFIGHLQRNKVKTAVKIFDMIQSVDSVKLAKKIDKEAVKIDKVQDVLVQVNISGEKQKYGIKPEETIEFINKIKLLRNINLKGLMCMAPYVDKEKTSPFFIKMKSIFDKLNLEILSMGMTNDYDVAIQEGSNMVRIGRAIFRERIK